MFYWLFQALRSNFVFKKFIELMRKIECFDNDFFNILLVFFFGFSKRKIRVLVIKNIAHFFSRRNFLFKWSFCCLYAEKNG